MGELGLVGVEAHGRAVGALGLLDLGERQGKEHHVRATRELEGGVALARALPAETLEAGLVAHEVEPGLADEVEQRVHARGVDGGGAGPLVARRLGKVAYQRNAGARRQGQQAALVLEQDAALRGGLARQGVVLRLAVGVGRGLTPRACRRGRGPGLVYAGVEHVLGKAPLPNRGNSEIARAQARRGHLKGGARRHPATWSLEPPQSVTTAPSYPHSSRRMSWSRWAFSLA